MGQAVDIPEHIRMNSESQAVEVCQKKRNMGAAVATAWSLILHSRIDPEKMEFVHAGMDINVEHDCYKDWQSIWQNSLSLWRSRCSELEKHPSVRHLAQTYNLDTTKILGSIPVLAALEDYIFPDHPVYTFFRCEHEIMLRGFWVCGFAGKLKSAKDHVQYPIGSFYYY